MYGVHRWEVLPPRAVSVVFQRVFGAAVRLWRGQCVWLFPEYWAVAAVKMRVSVGRCSTRGTAESFCVPETGTGSRLLRG